LKISSYTLAKDGLSIKYASIKYLPDQRYHIQAEASRIPMLIKLNEVAQFGQLANLTLKFVAELLASKSLSYSKVCLCVAFAYIFKIITLNYVRSY